MPADNIYQVHPDFPMQLIFHQQSVILMHCGPRKGLLLNWIRRRCSNIEANRRRRLVVTGRWTWMGSVRGDRGSIDPTATAMPADAFPGPFLVPLRRASKNDRLAQRSLRGATHGHMACRRKFDGSYRDAHCRLTEIGRCRLSAGIDEPQPRSAGSPARILPWFVSWRAEITVRNWSRAENSRLEFVSRKLEITVTHLANCASCGGCGVAAIVPSLPVALMPLIERLRRMRADPEHANGPDRAGCAGIIVGRQPRLRRQRRMRLSVVELSKNEPSCGAVSCR